MLIDIPKNIQTQLGSPEYPPPMCIRGYKPQNETVHNGQLKKAYKLLKQAKRPLILGRRRHQHRRAQEKLTAFAEKANVPVVTTIMGKEPWRTVIRSMWETAVCTVRGHRGQRVTCSFSIGTRFNDRITGDLK